jgi:hypothetical protein
MLLRALVQFTFGAAILLVVGKVIFGLTEALGLSPDAGPLVYIVMFWITVAAWVTWRREW